MAYELVPHVFAQGHTIEGAIRLHNSLVMSEEELIELVQEFNKVNDAFPPHAGEVVMVPVAPEIRDRTIEPKVEISEPKVEPKPEPKEQPAQLPPLKLGRKKVVRRAPKKKEVAKRPSRRHWWK